MKVMMLSMSAQAKPSMAKLRARSAGRSRNWQLMRGLQV